MANQNYVDQTPVHPDGLPGHMTSRRSSMVQPHTTPYPELESPPYSPSATPWVEPNNPKVTTFSQQHQINEAHLLTPVSGAGSPCVQQTANLPQYPSAMTPMQPQASPSGPSRMPWHNSVNMSAAQSQVGSPMPINPPTSESHFEMSYIPAENDDVPEPPTDYYWGNYTVSAQSEPEQGSLSPQVPSEYYMPHNGHHVMQPQPMMGQMPSELPMAQHAAPPVHTPYYPQQNPTTWVEHPDITHFKTTATRRRQFGYSLPSTQIARQGPIAQASGPSRPSRPQSVGRVARQPRMRGRITPPSRESTEAVNIAQAQLEEITPDLPDDFVIKEDCPDEQRFLFERQRELTAAGHKGRGMWEIISAEFNAKFKVDSDIPRLQMLVARGRYKYLRMSPRDQHLAAKAYGFVCQQFHKMAAHKFKEFGGGRTTPWGQSALECFAIDMGLVEECYVPMPNDPQVKTRRGKKVSNRLRSGAYSNAILQEAANNGGGVLEQNPELRDQIMDEIFEYRGDDAEGEEEDDAMFDKTYQTRSRGKGRQGVVVKVEAGQSVDNTSGKAASTGKAARSRRAPAKSRAKGRLVPKSRAS
ncbi:hypothetical protein ColTof4_06999 [Colletotrichum tofieldiae]|nr:hypothetical protein ColTof3_11943 [Colletotrichum tofieldiae]GKT74576.1 hypothetical protein ColTof4_06999 [Colletotrichum tofieldiae]